MSGRTRAAGLRVWGDPSGNKTNQMHAIESMCHFLPHAAREAWHVLAVLSRLS